MIKLTVLIILGLITPEENNLGIRHIYQLLITFWEIRRPGTGVMPNSETGERAAPSPKGGLRAVLEGLGYSRHPCARVLSVAGFSAFLRCFLAGRRFILAGREAPSLHREASSLQHPG